MVTAPFSVTAGASAVLSAPAGSDMAQRLRLEDVVGSIYRVSRRHYGVDRVEHVGAELDVGARQLRQQLPDGSRADNGGRHGRVGLRERQTQADEVRPDVRGDLLERRQRRQL